MISEVGESERSAVVIGQAKYSMNPLKVLCVCWTFRYHLDTLDLEVPIKYLGPLDTLWIPWT